MSTRKSKAAVTLLLIFIIVDNESYLKLIRLKDEKKREEENLM